MTERFPITETTYARGRERLLLPEFTFGHPDSPGRDFLNFFRRFWSLNAKDFEVPDPVGHPKPFLRTMELPATNTQPALRLAASYEAVYQRELERVNHGEVQYFHRRIDDVAVGGLHASFRHSVERYSLSQQDSPGQYGLVAEVVKSHYSPLTARLLDVAPLLKFGLPAEHANILLVPRPRQPETPEYPEAIKRLAANMQQLLTNQQD